MEDPTSHDTGYMRRQKVKSMNYKNQANSSHIFPFFFLRHKLWQWMAIIKIQVTQGDCTPDPHNVLKRTHLLVSRLLLIGFESLLAPNAPLLQSTSVHFLSLLILISGLRGLLKSISAVIRYWTSIHTVLTHFYRQFRVANSPNLHVFERPVSDSTPGPWQPPHQ